MGAGGSGQSTLTRNWTFLQGRTYRNTITRELIDQYLLPCRDPEEMAVVGQLCLSRSNLNHPNIPKLLYYSANRVNSQDCCGEEEATLTLYLQHTEGSLADGVGKGQGRCLCCGVAAGVGYLKQQYGCFWITPNMVFVNSLGGYGNSSTGRSIAKVWISSKLQQLQPQRPCSELQMATSMASLFTYIKQNGLCHQIPDIELEKQQSVEAQIGIIHEKHSQSPVQYPPSLICRKKTISAYTKPDHLLSVPTQESTQDFQLLNRQHRSISNMSHLRPSPSNLLPPPSSTQNKISKEILSSPKATPSKISFTYPTPPNSNSPAFFKSVLTASPATRYSSKNGEESPVTVSGRKTEHNTPVWKEAQERTFQIQEKEIGGSRGNDKGGMLTSEELEEKLHDLEQYPDEKIPELSENNSESYCSGSEEGADKVVESEAVPDQEEGKMNSLYSLESKLPCSLEMELQSNKKESLSHDQNKGRDHPSRLQLSQPITIHQIPKSAQTSQPPSLSSQEQSHHNGGLGLEQVFSANRRRKQQEQRSRQMNDNYSNYLKKFSEVLQLDAPGEKKTQIKSFSSRAQIEQAGGSEERGGNLQKTGSVKDYKKQRGSDPKGRKGWQGVGNLTLEGSAGSILDQEEERKASLLERIATTEKIIRQNRKKLQKMQLQKDLQKERELIQQETESRLSADMINDQTNRIREKVNQKREHFAELKAQATKILQDLHF